MQAFTLYSWNEIMAMIFSVVFGSAAYVAFVRQKKLENVTLSFIVTVLTINTFLVYLGSELLKLLNLGLYRNVALPLVALFGQYIMEYVHKKYPAILGGIFHKATNINLDKYDDNGEQDQTDNNDERDSS